MFHLHSSYSHSATPNLFERGNRPTQCDRSSCISGQNGAITHPSILGASTILVIDDDPSVQDLMQRVFSWEGFQVVTSASGQEGLRLARKQSPDAIVLDVMMPGMNRWAVLSAECENRIRWRNFKRSPVRQLK